ncbi:hypothetical protein [Micromonospora sp. LOL_015]|uniref:hypothetical protein n=1 Tax=Micromonospora sp. LOL_015 TaxID=3345416 RepID=UPI003A851909
MPYRIREVEMGNRDQLHDLRRQAHEAGIEGNSEMSEAELRQALKKVGKGADPQSAKQTTKQAMSR